MRFRARLGNNLWQLASGPEWLRFHLGKNRLEAVQKALLQESLVKLASTDYGRRFGVRRDWSYEEFAATIPKADYEDLQPFLAYSGGLLNERVRVWEPTGGSTGGSKWIPWTASLQAEFRRAVATWIGQMFWELPTLKTGRGYWQLTPKTSLERPAWLGDAAVGFESDGEYLGRLGRLLENWITI
ncbi:MAG: GH3 auxin-responsive promoter family protein, partial [Candidatus Eremiobacteraeota bacterium]|nr:GH3 auxin-responsive promoter family protein [Candidatus Eremiobacteraeota bacterium]